MSQPIVFQNEDELFYYVQKNCFNDCTECLYEFNWFIPLVFVVGLLIFLSTVFYNTGKRIGHLEGELKTRKDLDKQ